LFYIMENKVSTGLFRKFADERPDQVQNSDWQKEATANDPDLPVMGVVAEDADRFAQWFGGANARLPTREQWNKAAGLDYHNARPTSTRKGPFREDFDPNDPTQVAIDRSDPLPVGTATHDISDPFGCRDMAGNGYEWTRETDAGMIPLDHSPPDFTNVMVTGRSFNWSEPQPLTYIDLRSAAPEAYPYKYGQQDVGFRIVIECGQAAQVAATRTEERAP
jgi:formylglycine-generating enzyme required for sulfatase activity